MKLSPEDLQAASSQTIVGLDFYVTVKSRFAKMLDRASRLAKERGYESLFAIAPRTFVFPDDYDSWRAAVANKPETIWISKPGNGARGEGIYLVTDVTTVDPSQHVVLQEYIHNPHLLGGHKYTLRMYVAVTSLDPLRAWVFPDGLAKLATQPYSTSRDSFDNLYIHLTNPEILRHDTSADFTTQRMTHTDFRQQLRHANVNDQHLFKNIHTIIAKSLLAVREPVLQLQQRSAPPGHNSDHQCMLLGYDILVDADMRPWILEVNAGPSLAPEAGNTPQSEREQVIKEQVARDTLVLAGRSPKATIQFEPLFPSSEMKSWLPCYEVIHKNDRTDLEKINKSPTL